MVIQKFEDIIAWQKAQDLGVEVYRIFGKMKDYGFGDQICRASVSVSNNIAEGFDRKTDKDFVWFLYVALASCSEVKSMLYLAGRLKYIKDQDRDNLVKQSSEISKIIRGLIKSLKQPTD